VCIVISDHALDIVLATITDFNCVPVENVVKLVVGWEILRCLFLRVRCGASFM
jgi:hypothetical protein